MKVSFVTVCYRTPDLIRNLLKGVEAAKFSFPFEYFLVDNCAGDGTGDMVRERFPWVTVIDAPGNIGFGPGNNLALRRARGEYLMLANPDLTVFPGEMEKLIAFADGQSDAGIIGPKLLNPDRTTQRTFHRFHSPLIPILRRTSLGRTAWGERALHSFFMRDTDEHVVQDVDGLFGAALLIRQKAMASFGLFDERFFMYFEDVDLCRRSWESGWRVVYAPISTFVHYHQRESDAKHWWQIPSNRTSREHIRSAVKYFWKYRNVRYPRKP